LPSSWQSPDQSQANSQPPNDVGSQTKPKTTKETRVINPIGDSATMSHEMSVPNEEAAKYRVDELRPMNCRTMCSALVRTPVMDEEVAVEASLGSQSTLESNRKQIPT